jgi:LPS-assembly lipoprotein
MIGKLMKTLTYAVMLTALLSVSACGFKLRADFKPPASAMPIQIIPARAPLISRALNESLEDQGVELFDRRKCPKDKPASACVPQTKVYLRNEKMERRRLSVSSITQRLMEIEMIYRVEMEVRDSKDKVLMPPRTFEFQRDFSYDEDAPLATTAEAEYLRDELYKDMLDSIQRTLRILLNP